MNTYYDSDDDSYETTLSHKNLNIISHDDDRHVLKRLIKHKMRKIVVFTTKYTPGSTIRNAVTGFYQSDFHVGKSDEFNFFKISLAVDLGHNPVSKHLYYDSPEQYEQQFDIVVDPVIKSNWKTRFSNNFEVKDDVSII